MKKRILVRGPVLSQSGYGEQARFALRALRTQEEELDIHIQPIRWGHTGWIWEDTEERRWIDEMITKTAHYTREGGEFDMSLQITIPNEWQMLAPINIGYTAGIETTKVAPIWLAKGNQMDKIIVVSNHSKDAYKDTVATLPNHPDGRMQLSTPIEAINYAIRPSVGSEEIPGFNPDYDFNFLCVSQWGSRKNFENTIKWWVEEFHDQKVGLILKTSLANNSTIDKSKSEEMLKLMLDKYSNRKCKVYLLHGDLSDAQMRWLYQNDKVKCLVNIAHGEGYGLPMFEAAQNALPVLTIGWSGQLDFLSHKGKNYFVKVDHKLAPIQKEAIWKDVLVEGSEWAYADQGHFKMQLRKARKGWKKFKKQAVELQKILNENYTEERIYKQFTDSILSTELTMVAQNEQLFG